MAIVAYNLRVDHLVKSGTDYSFNPVPDFNGSVKFDTSAGSSTQTVSFGGFTLEFRLLFDTTQIEYKLSQPGNPMNGTARGLGMGIVWIEAVGGGKSILRQLDGVEINISSTEKLRISLEK